MTTQKKRTTKEKILETACDLFAAKGYRNTTIKDICEKADANIAAVNYHFGGKRKLFEQVWQHVFEVIHETYPPCGGLPDSTSPEEKLKAHIASVIGRIFDTGRVGQLNELIFTAMSSDDEEIQLLLFSVFQPYRERLMSIMKELAGPCVPQEPLTMCGFSTINQCFGFAFRKKLRVKLTNQILPSLTPEKIIDHIWKFSLAGVASVKAQYDTKGQK